LSEGVVAFFLDTLILIPQKDSDIFSRGIYYHPGSVINRKKTLGELLFFNNPHFVLIGLPVDSINDADLSPKNGPQAIRRIFHDRLIKNQLPDKIIDLGNIRHFPHIESLESLQNRLNYIIGY
jgi:hypothetical protein